MAGKILVTGASGFIAMQTILKLFEAGYDVRGTVRSMAKADALRDALRPHTPLADTIDIVEADLDADAGWTSAAEGCDFVQHIASPLPTRLPDDAMDLIRPARDGALRVLKAARQAGVKRVVMTSSVAAIGYGWGDKRPDLMTENHWSNANNIKDNTAYARSKTIAEKAAWDWLKTDGGDMELATINPGLVLGPVMSSDFSTSVEVVTQIMSGKLPAVPKLAFVITDVRDVALAHLRAMERPEAAGQRHIIADKTVKFTDLADWLREAFPSHAKKIPSGELPNWLVKLLSNVNPILKQVVPELGKTRAFDNTRMRTVLGVEPTDAKASAIASATDLIRLGVV